MPRQRVGLSVSAFPPNSLSTTSCLPSKALDHRLTPIQRHVTSPAIASKLEPFAALLLAGQDW
jgi:hypothetical protein